MAFNSGPTYSEWLEYINHHVHSSFDELHEITKRLEEEDKSSRLTTAQRTDLLERLGDMQIDAAHHAVRLS